MVQRYFSDWREDEMSEENTGDWVKYEDYAALEKELAELKSKTAMDELTELSQELKLYDN